MERAHEIERELKKLRMPGALQHLDERLAQAREQNLGYLEFLSLVIQDETVNREANNFAKRLSRAGFGKQATFEGFDFHFNETALPAATIRDLASCRFIEGTTNVAVAGPPGIGNYVKLSVM